MRALSSLLKDYDPRDPLVRVFRALLDSGMIIATRNGDGRFVQTSDVYATALGVDDDVRGGGFITGQRHFDASRKELSRVDHPAQVARMSGVPQRTKLLGVRAENGRELWMLASFMPLEQESVGWSVLTIGAPLPPLLVPSAETGRSPHAETLLTFALQVSGHQCSPAAMAELLRTPAADIGPPGATVTLAWQAGEHIRLESVVRRGDDSPLTPIRLTGESAGRWAMRETYYNPDVRDTDIVGSHVVVEYPRPIRSYALVPIFTPTGSRIASIGITHPEPDAFTVAHIEAYERLGRLAGPWLITPETRHQAA